MLLVVSKVAAIDTSRNNTDTTANRTQALIAQRDQDGDGQLSAKEFPLDPAMFKSMDGNNNALIDLDELSPPLRLWHQDLMRRQEDLWALRDRHIDPRIQRVNDHGPWPFAEEDLRLLFGRKFKDRFFQVQGICIEHPDITDQDLSLLTPFRNEIDHLDVNQSDLSREGFAKLGELPNIIWLGIRQPGLTDYAMASYSKLTHLKYLYVQDSKISDEGIWILRHNQSLSLVALDGSGITSQGMSCLAFWPNLTHLSLSRTQIDNEGLAHLKDVGNLQSLDISNTQVGDAGLKSLVPLTKLYELNLSGLNITSEGLSEIDRLDNLADLYLDRVTITKSVIAALGELDRLMRLYLRGCDIERDALLGMEGLHSLDSLDLRESRFEENEIRHVILAPKIKHLSLPKHVGRDFAATLFV